MNNSLLSDYERLLQQLEHWPSKRIIYDITSFANRNGRISNDIADILISRILDPKTNIAFKVPLFYLVDSIMRNVGGMYCTLFSAHIVIVFRNTFSEVNKMDQARLDYLLSSWEARRLLPAPLLADMRRIIGRRIVTVPPPRQLQHPAPFHSQQHNRSQHMPSLDIDRDRDRGRDMDMDRGDRHMGDRGGPLMHPHPHQHQPQFSGGREDSAFPTTGTGVNSRKRPFQPDRAPFVPHQHQQQYPQQYQQQQQHLQQPPLNIAPGLSGPPSRLVRALIGEETVTVDLSQAQQLAQRLQQDASSSCNSAQAFGLRQAAQLTAARLTALLAQVSGTGAVRDTIPPLPPFLSVPLPATLVAAREAEMQQKQPKKYLPVPQFRVELLSTPPNEALKALYQDRSFYCRQDGSRFKSQAELAAHLDELFRLKENKKKNDSLTQHREWYCLHSQWVSDFGALSVKGGGQDAAAAGDLSEQAMGVADKGGDSGGGSGLAEEMIVPADEHFTRCPVSNEAFIPEWDDEEGDYMYKNAVKVLVTAASDEALFAHCQPTAQEGLRYAIVHQLLVMDGWLAGGRAITVKDATLRLRSDAADCKEEGTGRWRYAEQALLSALGEEDDEEDVFLVLDADGNIGADLFQNTNSNSISGDGNFGQEHMVVEENKEEEVFVNV